MKTSIKTLLVGVLLSFMFSVSAQDRQPGNAPAEPSIAAAIEQQHFLFKAETMQPTTGRFRMLTASDFDVRVTKDSLISYLPYMGRAYTAPINPLESPLDFVSTSFTVSKEVTKRGNWIITYKVNDNSEVRQMIFTIGTDGNASLNVLFNNRQSINFNGDILEVKS